MALSAHRSFKEYYNALVARVPTDEERINNVIRSEYSFRKAIERAQFVAFRDVLHVAGIMIADKKRMEKGDLPLGLTTSQMEEYHRSRRVWFPQRVPRVVPPRSRPGPKGYPHKASREIQGEETEIRNWIVAVESKLRESIFKQREDSMIGIREMETIRFKEERARNRIVSEEIEGFAAIRKKLFLAAPPEYFRKLVIERYGVSKAIEPRELTLEEREEEARKKLEEEELADFKKTWGYLDFVYGAYFYMLNHGEIVGRGNIENKERDELYNVIAQSCRKSGGLTFYYTPSVALHCSNDSTPVLQQVTKKVLEEKAHSERPKVYTGKFATME